MAFFAVFGTFTMSPKPPVKVSRSSYRRRLMHGSRASIKQYAALTAEMLWAWNRLNSTLLDLFRFLLNAQGADVTEEAANAIWHAFQSDKAQRDMLRAVADATLPPRSTKLKQIRWIINSINRIAPYRNAVIHVPVIFQIYKPGRPHDIHLDSTGARDEARRRLEFAGSRATFWNAMAGDLFTLGQFAGSLHRQGKPINEAEPNGEVYSSLHRPRLLSLRRIAEIDRQMSLPQASAIRPRQQRASQRKP